MNTAPAICVIGDTHGHLQLALCVAARWQHALRTSFEAVLLCGDVGAFTHESQLDNATRRHARENPCELEFLHQWAVHPQPPWIGRIFLPENDGGLGLLCPVIMVHGNHEGFNHLVNLATGEIPTDALGVGSLPTVDSGGHIRYLPSGWRVRTDSGRVIAGVGGIQRGQRRTTYHDMAYLNEIAILSLLEGVRPDILVTHQGPSGVQGDEKGSKLLQTLLDERVASYWFHGHSTPNLAVTKIGLTTVVPLGHIAFPGRGSGADEPGPNGWSYIRLGRDVELQRERPSFWREYRRTKWVRLPNTQLVSPDFASVVYQVMDPIK